MDLASTVSLSATSRGGGAGAVAQPFFAELLRSSDEGGDGGVVMLYLRRNVDVPLPPPPANNNNGGNAASLRLSRREGAVEQSTAGSDPLEITTPRGLEDLNGSSVHLGATTTTATAALLESSSGGGAASPTTRGRQFLAFYFLALKSPDMTDTPESPFAKAVSNRRNLELFAVRTKGFRHTGRGYSGVCNVSPGGVANIPLPAVLPNTTYCLGVTFSSDPSWMPPFQEFLVLREAKNDATTTTKVVSKARPHSPWGIPKLRSLHAVRSLASVYSAFVAKANHRRRGQLWHEVVVKGVSDANCEIFIACVYSAILHLRATEPSVHKFHRDPSAASLFTAMTELCAPTPACVHKGPWIVDWFAFCLLATLPEKALPRASQLARQFHAAPAGAEGDAVQTRLPYMALPESRGIPVGTPIELYAPPVNGPADFMVGDVAALVHFITKQDDKSKEQQQQQQALASSLQLSASGSLAGTTAAAKRRKYGAARIRSAATVGEQPKELSLREASEQAVLSKALQPTTTGMMLPPGARWTAARAIWALCPVREQLLVLMHYVRPLGAEALAAKERPAVRLRIKRETDDVEAEGYWDLDSDEEFFDEALLASPPMPVLQRTPWAIVVGWSRHQQGLFFAPATAAMEAKVLLLHTRERYETWRKWFLRCQRRNELHRRLLRALSEVQHESDKLRLVRERALRRECMRSWRFVVLTRHAIQADERNVARHLLLRFRAWQVFAAPTPFRVKRPVLSVAPSKPCQLHVVVEKRTTVHALCVLGSGAHLEYTCPLSSLSSASTRLMKFPPQLVEYQSPALITASPSFTGDSTPGSFRRSPTHVAQGRALNAVQASRQAKAKAKHHLLVVPSRRAATPEPDTLVAKQQKPQPATVPPRAVAPLISAALIRSAFPTAAAFLKDAPFPAFDTKRVIQLSPLVHALWAVNYYRTRAHCFQVWVTYSKTTILHRKQQDFVDRNMIPMQRKIHRAYLNNAWAKWTALAHEARAAVLRLSVSYQVTAAPGRDARMQTDDDAWRTYVDAHQELPFLVRVLRVESVAANVGSKSPHVTLSVDDFDSESASHGAAIDVVYDASTGHFKAVKPVTFRVRRGAKFTLQGSVQCCPAELYDEYLQSLNNEAVAVRSSMGASTQYPPAVKLATITVPIADEGLKVVLGITIAVTAAST